MRKLQILLLILGMISTVAHAETIKINLEKAVSMALGSSEDVRMESIKAEKLDHQYDEALSGALPKLNLEAGVNRNLESPTMTMDLSAIPGLQMVPPIETPLLSKWEVSGGLTLMQPIWTFGKISTALDIADQAIDMQKNSMKQKRQDVVYETKKAYYTVLFATQFLKIARESHENALRNKDALRRRFMGGRISRSDNVKMNADIAQRIPVEMQAEMSLDLALKQFKTLIGISEETEVELMDSFKEEFEEYSVEDKRILMFGKDPTLKLLDQSIRLSDNVVSLNKAARWPTISGFANYTYAGKDDSFLPGSDSWNPTFIVGVKLTVPIWDSWLTSARVGQAVADRNTAEQTYHKVQKQMKLAIESAVINYNSLIKTYKANMRALNLTKKTYNIFLSNFSSGGVTQLQLNDAEQMLTGAKIQVLKTRYEINNSIALIEKLTGGGDRS